MWNKTCATCNMHDKWHGADSWNTLDFMHIMGRAWYMQLLPTFWISPATWLHSVYETAVPISQLPQHSWWGLVLAKIPREIWFVDCSCIAWNIQFWTNLPGVSSRFYLLWHKIWVEAWLGQEQSSKLSCAKRKEDWCVWIFPNVAAPETH